MAKRPSPTKVNNMAALMPDLKEFLEAKVARRTAALMPSEDDAALARALDKQELMIRRAKIIAEAHALGLELQPDLQ